MQERPGCAVLREVRPEGLESFLCWVQTFNKPSCFTLAENRSGLESRVEAPERGDSLRGPMTRDRCAEAQRGEVLGGRGGGA